MWPAVYGPAPAVIEAFEVEAYGGRIQLRRPCHTLSFKATAKRPEQAVRWKGRPFGAFLQLLRQGNVCNYAIKAHYHRLYFFFQLLNSVN